MTITAPAEVSITNTPEGTKFSLRVPPAAVYKTGFTEEEPQEKNVFCAIVDQACLAACEHTMMQLKHHMVTDHKMEVKESVAEYPMDKPKGDIQ